MTLTTHLSRRRLLQTLGSSLPLITLPGFVQAATAAPGNGNILVLIELSGGNDGLNTVIPRGDDAYRALRPQIGIAAQDMLGLDDDTALHPAMRPFADLWEQDALQIVQGVGYPNPNRSHFRAIEIWDAGLGADGDAGRGWMSAALDGQPQLAQDADGLVLGGSMGPLAGAGYFSALRDADAFLDRHANLPDTMHPVRPAEASTPLAHVLATYERARVMGDTIHQKLVQSPARDFAFPETELGLQLRNAARLLDAGIEVASFKVVQGGFDTHDSQPNQHAMLLDELSRAIAAFRDATQQIGLWDRITLVTYSEFGRTARENASYGTDHGTAAPLFVMGGNVKGGFGGRAPSLTDLVDDDLVHTTDYRQVYAALLDDLWGISAPLFDAGETPLNLLRSG